MIMIQKVHMSELDPKEQMRGSVIGSRRRGKFIDRREFQASLKT